MCPFSVVSRSIIVYKYKLEIGVYKLMLDFKFTEFLRD